MSEPHVSAPAAAPAVAPSPAPGAAPGKSGAPAFFPASIRWMIEQTSFEEPNARAEVHRYTYTPTYQLSYLLGKVLLLQLRADEQRRLGARFSLRGFHDALLRAGSLPISFQRRLLTAAGA